MSTRPPLNALHVFCAVVREGGVRPAAQALHVTPGAVSRQVQALEAHLGQRLFTRDAGAAPVLTPAGQRLHGQVADRLAAITDALDAPARTRRSTIHVDTSVTLAMHWLIPLLRSFAQRHPRLNVQVRTTDGAIDPAAAVDVFIRREVAELRGLPSQVFMAERAVLVASPAFGTMNSAGSPRWLARQPRIGARSRPDLWPCWSRHHGFGGDALAPTVEFDNTILAIQAAAQGLGACVVPEVFVAGMLAAGTLRLLQPTRVASGSYSYAVRPGRDAARVRAFTDWLLELGS